jgi:hypothetical protein
VGGINFSHSSVDWNGGFRWLIFRLGLRGLALPPTQNSRERTRGITVRFCSMDARNAARHPVASAARLHHRDDAARALKDNGPGTLRCPARL